MTIEQKAKAFDLIASGQANGMSLFWERFSEITKVVRENGDASAMAIMGRYAAEEASNQILDAEYAARQILEDSE